MGVLQLTGGGALRMWGPPCWSLASWPWSAGVDPGTACPCWAGVPPALLPPAMASVPLPLLLPEAPGLFLTLLGCLCWRWTDPGGLEVGRREGPTAAFLHPPSRGPGFLGDDHS